ncbi:hypothetical protein DPMN_136637 [Dreissena polymorpha]|uniref:Uncharacterized protein n=1 Tax=Dreissena polymorpha TaxID=45954 RepID=A0A9D4G068_DREPO|nr:hypothetical protein DPMN_136637 [Dreissena polymorpha]
MMTDPLGLGALSQGTDSRTQSIGAQSHTVAQIGIFLWTGGLNPWRGHMIDMVNRIGGMVDMVVGYQCSMRGFKKTRLIMETFLVGK